MSRTGDRCSPFGVALPKAGNGSRFRLRLATMRRIGEIRQANFLGRRSGDFGGVWWWEGDFSPAMQDVPP